MSISRWTPKCLGRVSSDLFLIFTLSTLFGQFPFIKKLFADSAYAGLVFHDDLANVMPNLATEIVRRCDRANR